MDCTYIGSELSFTKDTLEEVNYQLIRKLDCQLVEILLNTPFQHEQFGNLLAKLQAEFERAKSKADEKQARRDVLDKVLDKINRDLALESEAWWQAKDAEVKARAREQNVLVAQAIAGAAAAYGIFGYGLMARDETELKLENAFHQATSMRKLASCLEKKFSIFEFLGHQLSLQTTNAEFDGNSHAFESFAGTLCASGPSRLTKKDDSVEAGSTSAASLQSEHECPRGFWQKPFSLNRRKMVTKQHDRKHMDDIEKKRNEFSRTLVSLKCEERRIDDENIDLCNTMKDLHASCRHRIRSYEELMHQLEMSENITALCRQAQQEYESISASYVALHSHTKFCNSHLGSCE